MLFCYSKELDGCNLYSPNNTTAEPVEFSSTGVRLLKPGTWLVSPMLLHRRRKFACTRRRLAALVRLRSLKRTAERAAAIERSSVHESRTVSKSSTAWVD